MRAPKASGNPDAAPAFECICFNLRKASKALTHLYEETMRPSGLRGTQFPVLTALRFLGPIPVSRLAKRLATDRTTLTRNLEVLEREGLVQIETGDDRRVRHVSITRKGEAARERALPYWKKAQTRVAKKLGDVRLGRLLDELRFLTTEGGR